MLHDGSYEFKKRVEINEWTENLRVDYLNEQLQKCIEEEKQREITDDDGQQKQLNKQLVELIQDYKILSLIKVIKYESKHDSETRNGHRRNYKSIFGYKNIRKSPIINTNP